MKYLERQDAISALNVLDSAGPGACIEYMRSMGCEAGLLEPAIVWGMDFPVRITIKNWTLSYRYAPEPFITLTLEGGW